MRNLTFGKEFKELSLPGYRNINELFEQNTQLHSGETLFGDWNARVMVLAQDAANFNTLKKLKDNVENPFRHNPDNKTNKNLYEVVRSLDHFKIGSYTNPNNRNCGLYYANAIWLLKDSDDMSGPISDKKLTYDINSSVFEATLNNLPNLKLILTLGEHSFNFVKNFFEDQIDSNWHLTVSNNEIHKVNSKNCNYVIGSIYHTSNRGMIARARRDGITGEKSCKAGIEITKQDLEKIFSSINFLQ